MLILSFSVFEDTVYKLLQTPNFIILWAIHLFKLFWSLWEIYFMYWLIWYVVFPSFFWEEYLL